MVCGFNDHQHQWFHLSPLSLVGEMNEQQVQSHATSTLNCYRPLQSRPPQIRAQDCPVEAASEDAYKHKGVKEFLGLEEQHKAARLSQFQEARSKRKKLLNLKRNTALTPYSIQSKIQDVSKGLVAEKIFSSMAENGKQTDFVLCVGDDRSDEDMFEVISSAISRNILSSNASVFACRVGQKPSKAKYYLDDTFEIISKLESLAKESDSSPCIEETENSSQNQM